MQKLCVRNGHIWERSELHLKSAISYDFKNFVKRIELDLLKKAM